MFIKIHHQKIDEDGIPVGASELIILNCDHISTVHKSCDMYNTIRNCKITDYDKFNLSCIKLKDGCTISAVESQEQIGKYLHVIPN